MRVETRSQRTEALLERKQGVCVDSPLKDLAVKEKTDGMVVNSDAESGQVSFKMEGTNASEKKSECRGGRG